MTVSSHPLPALGSAHWQSETLPSLEGKLKGLFLIHGNEFQEESFRPSFKFSGSNKSHKICKEGIIKNNEKQIFY